jgi:hypothetical protein
MRQTQCSRCQATLPTSDTWNVLGSTVCEFCGNALLSEHDKPLVEGDVVRNLDPTICHRCQADSGQELPQVAQLPTCPDCESHLRNFPFPAWIKLSFAALVILAIVSFVYNYRFVDGLFTARRAWRAMYAGKVDVAIADMDKAAGLVPEMEQFRNESGAFRGYQLLSQDQPKQAVPLLANAVKKISPQVLPVYAWLLQAEMGAAFEDKQYDVMLEKALALVGMKPDDPFGQYLVASSYACEFARTGAAELKQKSLEALAAGDKLAETHPIDPAGAENYRQRIRFRLATREIIEKNEFDRRFPNGWQEGEQSE